MTGGDVITLSLDRIVSPQHAHALLCQLELHRPKVLNSIWLDGTACLCCFCLAVMRTTVLWMDVHELNYMISQDMSQAVLHNM